jgi:hypothetical protein
MSRLTIGLALVSSLFAVKARAKSQAEIAADENEEGKQLMFENKYAEASAKFQDAHSRVPEPKYFFNHCTSLFWEGKFGEALTACNAADKNADDKLKTKIATLEDKIRTEAKKQNIDLQPVGGGAGPGETPPVDPNQPPPDPNNPTNPTNPGTTGAPPAGQPPYAVGAPPAVGLYSQAQPQNTYTWSMGIDFFGGGGKMGAAGAYGHSAGGFRIKADYILNAAQRIGAQGYFHLSSFTEGSNNTAGTTFGTLSVFGLGLAGYKHLCGPTARVCLTPLVGAELALLSPSNMTDSSGDTVFNYASLGARAEMALQFMLGSRYQHVIEGMVGLNGYTRSISQPTNGLTSAEVGLDKGGFAFYIGAGYTYRFNTPFGSAPFVTLE